MISRSRSFFIVQLFRSKNICQTNNDLSDLKNTVTTLNSKIDNLNFYTISSKTRKVSVNQGFTTSVASIPLSEFGVSDYSKVLLKTAESSNGWVIPNVTYDTGTNSIVIHTNAGAAREADITVHLFLR